MLVHKRALIPTKQIIYWFQKYLLSHSTPQDILVGDVKKATVHFPVNALEKMLWNSQTEILDTKFFHRKNDYSCYATCGSVRYIKIRLSPKQGHFFICLICKPVDISVPHGWTHKSLRICSQTWCSHWLVSVMAQPTMVQLLPWFSLVVLFESCQAGPSPSFPMTGGWWSILTS